MSTKRAYTYHETVEEKKNAKRIQNRIAQQKWRDANREKNLENLKTIISKKKEERDLLKGFVISEIDITEPNKWIVTYIRKGSTGGLRKGSGEALTKGSND